MKKLYVGNLSFNATEEDVRQWFAPHGSVESAALATDRTTGRSRGFAFVEMSSDGEAEAAIAALNGSEVGGRALVVNEARPKAANSGTGFGGERNGNRRNSSSQRRSRW